MNDDDVIIVGGGLAALRTAQALRDLQHSGKITLLSGEHTLPYDRPPLSKGYLLGKVGDDQIRLLTEDKLAALAIEVRLGSCAVGLDRSARRVLLGDGRSVAYGRLVVATGARPMRVPPFEGTGFDNVHTMRNAQDARRLREALLPGRRLGIVGAGFIGLEIAAAGLEMGCSVTLVELASAPLAAVLGAELGTCVQRYHERRGVRFHCGASVLAVRGSGSVNALKLSNGAVVDVDAVVLGAGQTANVEWLADSGLALHRGLVCDVHGRTEDLRVFGVGDVVCTQVGEALHPTRQWTAVTEQARRTAEALCGRMVPGPVIDDNYFWSDQHGLRLQFAGQVPPEARLVWVNGGPEADRFAVLCCTPDEVAAVVGLGCPREFLVHSMPLRRGERATAPVAA